MLFHVVVYCCMLLYDVVCTSVLKLILSSSLLFSTLICLLFLFHLSIILIISSCLCFYFTLNQCKQIIQATIGDDSISYYLTKYIIKLTIIFNELLHYL